MSPADEDPTKGASSLDLPPSVTTFVGSGGDDTAGLQAAIDAASARPMVAHARRPHFRKAGLRVRLEFKLADLWIGAFWKRAPAWRHYPWDRIHVWVCILPCLPIHIEWDTMPTDPEGPWT